MKASIKLLSGIVGVSAIALFSSCTPGQQTGAQYGALGGAALGVLTGDDTEGVVTKAGIGAAIGAIVVAAQEEHNQRTAGGYDQQPTSNAPTEQSYPYGISTETAGYVKSPYPPHNVVNVQGIARGTKVTEPGSTNIFIVP